MHPHFIILRHLRRPSRHDHHHLRHYHPSTITSSITWVRDRALDHAVEKERDLKPMINLKNLIITEPSKTLPLSIITDKKSSLSIPIRPIDFIRKYPSIFQEFLPGGIGIHPHVKLTPETLTLDAEEQILFDSESHKQDVANRLLKLLMIGRVNRIPLSVIDRLKWDLGLPNDYVQTVVPYFPDYFRVSDSGLELELVCWNDELAVSVMKMNMKKKEAKNMKKNETSEVSVMEMDMKKNETMNLKKNETVKMKKNETSEFPVKYSRGFEVDKKFKKWVDEWQKLPYVSPYENLMSLKDKSEEFDKWVVGLLHEVLHILVPKKTEKDNLLVYGEFLGVRSRFKKALLEHPGIFYVSSKLNTHTVVLREGYKRDLLVDKVWHPVMMLRGSYIHLMNMVKEKSKVKGSEEGGEEKEKETRDLDGEVDEMSDDVSEQEEDDDESEDVIDGDSQSESESEDLDEKQRKPTKKTKLEGRKSPVKRNRRRRSDDNSETEDLDEMQRTPIKKLDLEGRKSPVHRSRTRRSEDKDESEDLEVTQRTPIKRSFERRTGPVQRSRMRRSNNVGESEDLENGNSNFRERTSRTMRFNDTNRRNTPNSRVYDNDGRRDGGKDRKHAVGGKYGPRTSSMPDRRVANETNPTRFLRTESPGARASRDRSSVRSDGSRTSRDRSSARSDGSRMRDARSLERSDGSRTRDARSLERSNGSRTREGRSSERSRVSRTREGRF